MNTLPDVPTRPRRWADLEEAARYSTFSTTTLKRMVREGKLPRYSPRNGRVVVDLNELDAVIAASAVVAGAQEP
jgi:hypothetical protein